jgi:hypothetical protein
MAREVLAPEALESVALEMDALDAGRGAR